MQQLWTQAKIEKALGSLIVEVKGRTGRPLTEVSTDSRHLSRGAVFVALKGDKFDGHDYAAAAQRNGAELLIVERPIGTPVPEIIVTEAQTYLYLEMPEHIPYITMRFRITIQVLQDRLLFRFQRHRLS